MKYTTIAWDWNGTLLDDVDADAWNPESGAVMSLGARLNDGIVYSTDVVTVTVVVGENADHELHVESVKYSTDEAAAATAEAIGDAAGVITNTPEVKDFEFTKKWRNANGTDWDEWVKDITVKLYRKVRDTDDVDFVKTFTLSGESGEADGISWTRIGDAESGYKFTFKDLEKYTKVTVDTGADSESVEASGSSGTSGTTLEQAHRQTFARCYFAGFETTGRMRLPQSVTTICACANM